MGLTIDAKKILLQKRLLQDIKMLVKMKRKRFLMNILILRAFIENMQ